MLGCGHLYMIKEIMSEDLHIETGIMREDDKERIVDIYVSAESLRVYEEPWMEDKSTDIPGPSVPQHPESVVSENLGRRNHDRSDPVFVGVCLLLLAGILALICLGVQMKKEKSNWRRERNQLLADTNILRKRNLQLRTNNTKLSQEIDNLWNKLCRHRTGQNIPDEEKKPVSGRMRHC